MSSTSSAGLTPLEDLLEEIVGEIRGEFDAEEELLPIVQPEGSYLRRMNALEGTKE